MKTTYFLILASILFAVQSCDHALDNSFLGSKHPEALTPDDVEFLDNMPEAYGFDSVSVILPNGESLAEFLSEADTTYYQQGLKSLSNSPYAGKGPQEARNLLISKLGSFALELCDDTKQMARFTGTPEQRNGLAYSWNSKDHTIRKLPWRSSDPKHADIEQSNCNYEIYGLDCSGFIYQLFLHAGVKINTGTADMQRNPETLEEKIKQSIPELDKIKVEDLGELGIKDFESGDLIYWMRGSGKAKHIGMVLKKSDGSLAVFQSNGDVGTNSYDCDHNLSDDRGPRPIELSLVPNWFKTGTRYGVVRINAELSGSWSLFLRCNTESTDALVFQLDFPTGSENSFEVSGTGKDYDGKALICTGTMVYNSVENKLAGTLLIKKPSVPEFYRNDSFEVKLSKDETAYFPLKLGASNNAGCELEGRLLNNEGMNQDQLKKALEIPSSNGSYIFSK
jgi:cell wall-associated NlpC family hydrolase